MSGKEQLRSVRRVLRRDGVRAVASKAVQRFSRRAEAFYGWPNTDFPLLWEDVNFAVQGEGVSPGSVPTSMEPGRLRIGWVCLPPSSGSGGHTTLFRMVQAMEERGHECFIYLYDRDSEDVQRHAQTIRSAWPDLKAEIRSARPRIVELDAVVASSWETAHVVASRADASLRRFYFVQDYEPFFYPRGALWELAESTYRFEFTTIALGQMVAHSLESFAGVAPDHIVPFGCDTDIYKTASVEPVHRSGIVFYAKQHADRRGYWLAKRALELFHANHPDQEIHVVGDRPSGWNIPVTVHGSIRPATLNSLYGKTLAGIALSFTNISLAAEEMLAAGVIPVVNDSVMARMDLAIDGPMWVTPTPEGIALGLARIVLMDRESLQTRRESADIRQGWGSVGTRFAEILERSFLSETEELKVAKGFIPGVTGSSAGLTPEVK